MGTGTIYGLIDPRDDSLRYIGKTMVDTDVRLRQHIAEAKNTFCPTLKLKWLRKLILLHLSPTIVALETDISEGDIDDAERFWISSIRAAGGNIKNMTCGGDGVRLFGEKNGMHGRSHSEKTLSKIRAFRARQGNPRKGTGRDPYIIKCLTCCRDFETKRLRSKYCSMRCYHRSDFRKHKHGGRHMVRPVHCIDTGTFYIDAGEAARELGLRRDYVTRVCRGEASSTGGMRFSYTE